MNELVEKLLLALNLSNPNNSGTDKLKATINYCIDKLRTSNNHKANLKEIVKRATEVKSIAEARETYITATQ